MAQLTKEEELDFQRLEALEKAEMNAAKAPEAGPLTAAEEADFKRLEALEAAEKATDVGALEAGARSLAEGLTLGFSEEIAGQVVGFFEGEEAERQFEVEQEQRRLAGERKYGKFTTGSELAGSVVTAAFGMTTAAAGLAAIGVTLPVSGAAGLGVALAAGAIGGATLAAGKSTAEVGSEQFAQDVAIGSALGFVAAPLGVAGGKLGAATMQKTSQVAGSLFKKFSDPVARAAASGDLGPGARKIVDEAMEEMMEREGKSGASALRELSPEEFADDLMLKTRDDILSIKAPTFKAKPDVEDLGPAKQVFDAERFGLTSAGQEARKAELRNIARVSTGETRQKAIAVLKQMDEVESDFIQLVGSDIKAALRGDYGQEAQEFVKGRLKAQGQKILQERAKTDAAHASSMRKASSKIREIADSRIIRKIEQMTGMNVFRAAKAVSGISALEAGIKAGTPAAGRGLRRIGIEQGSIPVVAATLSNPQGD